MNEIRIVNSNKKTPFTRWNINRKFAVKFSEDPKFRIQGKDVSIREFTNKNAIDTNIYEVIEKYRGDLKMSAAELNQFHNEIAQELTEIKNLPDALMQMKAAEEAWKTLPIDIRKEFGNSIQRFIKNGGTYLNEKITAYNKQMEAIKLTCEKAEKTNKITQTEVKE